MDDRARESEWVASTHQDRTNVVAMILPREEEDYGFTTQPNENADAPVVPIPARFGPVFAGNTRAVE